MNPVSIKLINLFSHKNTIINFRKLQFVLIKGITGSGKSSIFDALCWILYGKIPRKNYKAIIRDVPIKQKSGYGIFKFEIGKNIYTVKRVVGGSIVLYVNNIKQDFRNNTLAQEKIIDIVGCDLNTFLNVAYFSQGDIGKFLTSDSSERVKIITNILPILNKFDKAAKLIDYDIKKLNNKIIGISGKLSGYNETIKSLDVSNIRQLRTMSNAVIRKCDSELSVSSLKFSYTKEKVELLEILKDIDNNIKHFKDLLNDQILDVNNSIKNIKFKLQNKDKLFAKLHNIDIQLNKINIIKGILDDAKIKSEKIGKHISVLKIKIGVLESEHDNLSKSIGITAEGGICPTCNRKFDNKVLRILTDKKLKIRHKLKKLYKTLSLEKKSSLQAIKCVKIQNNRLNKLQNLNIGKQKLLSRVKEIENADKIISKLKETKANIKSKIKSKLIIYNKKKAKYQNDLSYYNEYDVNDLERYEKEYYKLLENKENAERNLRQLNYKIGIYFKYKNRIKDISTDLKKLENKMDIILWNKNNLPEIKLAMIQTIIPIIEKEANKYLSQIMPGKMVKFDFKPYGSKHKLNVNIYDYENERYRIFEGWSGGQKSKISLSVYLALNKIASIRSGKRINFLILDEKLSNLDMHNVSVVLEMLKNEYKGRKIFVLSHIDKIDSIFKNVINVTMNNNISKVEVNNVY